MYNLLRGARVSNSEKMEDLAKLLNMCVSTYGLKEREISDFTLKEARKLAQHYGRTIEDLFFGE